MFVNMFKGLFVCSNMEVLSDFDKPLFVLSYSITIIQVIPRYSILGMYVILYFFSCPGAHFPIWRLEISSMKTGSLFPEFGQKDDDDDNNNNNDIKTV